MVNKIITGLAIAVVMALIYVGLYIVNDMKELKDRKADSPEVKEVIAVEETVTKVDVDADIVGVENPFVEEEENFEALLVLNLNPDTTEDHIQNIIHQMSHQKVIAEAKRGKIPLTKKTVNDLHDFLINSPTADAYTHIQTYREISSKWTSGEFSEVHKDHNAIWELQNGQIGYATGSMTKTNEQDYIFHNYGQDFYEFLEDTGELIGN